MAHVGTEGTRSKTECMFFSGRVARPPSTTTTALIDGKRVKVTTHYTQVT